MFTGEPDESRPRRSASLDGAIMTLRILVMAFCMSVGGFLVVGTLVLKSASVRPSEDATLRTALVGLAITSLLASIVVRRRQLRDGTRASGETGEDLPARRIGERGENAAEAVGGHGNLYLTK